MRAFAVFVKVIGNECFITNNQKYISNFRQFLKKVVDTCCLPDSKYKQLLGVLVEESIIENYHCYFSELVDQD